ncbi:MAG: Cof-type HAD-IIB family hydrolase [Clostridia bacterium]|nr:Cof-type HAD-IIB family hydrolase [Clostridia bacterium]
MICMDLDGTLLDPGGNVSDLDARAVREAQENGIVCAIASGRAEGNVILMLRDAGLVCPACVLNGGLVIDEKGEILDSCPMDRALSLKICDMLAEEKLKFVLLGDKTICTSEKGFPHHSEEKYGERMREMGHRFAHGLDELRSFAREGTTYKYYLCEMEQPGRILDILKGIPGISVTRSGRQNFEIMPAQVNKVRGIAVLCRHYGIGMDRVMCIGDEMNDLEMIRAAGVGVAMGNAAAEVKDMAGYVTFDNASGGVAQAIRSLALAPLGK